jgi:hypothetical protein
MKLSDKAVSNTRRILVYGAPKSGKTELVSQLSKHFNLLWFDLENGYTTLLKLPPEQQARIELISVPDSRVYPIAVETMLKVIRGDKVQICEKHGKINCMLCKADPAQPAPTVTVALSELGPDTIVVIDSLTQFSNSCVANITKTQPDDYKMDYEDWGNLKVLVDKFLSQVQAAKFSIVCITHEEEVTMEDGKHKLVPVCGSSKSSRNTAKYFDDVVYCEMKNKKHCFGSGTGYSLNAITGSRAGVSLENSAVPELYELFSIQHAAALPSIQTAKNTAATAGLVALKVSLTSGGIRK